MNTRFLACCFFFSLLQAFVLAATPHQTHGPLRVSENRRFLVHQDGTPFFYLGDTAWELFHRLTREEADEYLQDRADKGFTVIQAVALAEFDGLNEPNAYGHTPLTENDPARPATKDGPQNDYWDHVDEIIAKAESLGLFIGFLPTWGDKWNKKWGQGPEIFTPANAEAYGEWLGRRYQGRAIIWILGGDRPIESDAHREIIRGMARGLRKAIGREQLITFHPGGGHGSAEYFHAEEWLDFNMRQNGHQLEFTGRYDATRADYDRTPVKPVLDAEPIYEDHPVNFKAPSLGHSTSADVRRPLYWNLFSGACGHTYGHHSVWQMYVPGQRTPKNLPLLSWQKALQQPGAKQMLYGRLLLESRPILDRIPDDSIVIPSDVPTSLPGAGTRRYTATRDQKGTYAMIYAPIGRPFSVKMDVIKGPKVTAWWFNPRNGEAHSAGSFTHTSPQEFTPPDPGELLDWVLVLDDAAAGYGKPGAVK